MGDETKWINQISPVEAQQLTVRILTVLGNYVICKKHIFHTGNVEHRAASGDR